MTRINEVAKSYAIEPSYMAAWSLLGKYAETGTINLAGDKLVEAMAQHPNAVEVRQNGETAPLTGKVRFYVKA